MEIMGKAYTISNEEATVILEIISNIRHVFPSQKTYELLEKKGELLNDLNNKLVIYTKTKNNILSDIYYSLIKDILDHFLTICKNDDEIQTYTGQSKSFIQALIRKLDS